LGNAVPVEKGPDDTASENRAFAVEGWCIGNRRGDRQQCGVELPVRKEPSVDRAK